MILGEFGNSGDVVKCSFCGEPRSEVRNLIAGPGVYICDECTALAHEIINQEAASHSLTERPDTASKVQSCFVRWPLVDALGRTPCDMGVPPPHQ